MFFKKIPTQRIQNSPDTSQVASAPETASPEANPAVQWAGLAHHRQLTPDIILSLQRTIGNRAVQRLLKKPPSSAQVQRLQIKKGKDKPKPNVTPDEILDFLFELDAGKLVKELQNTPFEMACLKAMCEDASYKSIIISSLDDFNKTFTKFKKEKGDKIRGEMKEATKEKFEKKSSAITKEKGLESGKKETKVTNTSTRRGRKGGALINLNEHSWQQVLELIFEHEGKQAYIQWSGESNSKEEKGQDTSQLQLFNQTCYNLFVEQTTEEEKEYSSVKQFLQTLAAFKDKNLELIMGRIKNQQEREIQAEENWQSLLSQIEEMPCPTLIFTLLKQLEPIVNSGKSGSNQAAQRLSVQHKAPLLVTLLQNLNIKIVSLTTYSQVLEVLGFINTLEFDLLQDSQITDITELADRLGRGTNKMAHSMESQAKVPSSQEYETEETEKETEPSHDDKIQIMLYNELNQIYPIDFSVFVKLLAGTTLSTHGKKASSQKASLAQIKGTFHELLLCAPMIIEMDKCAVSMTEFIKWDSFNLMVKILSHTVRRYKVESMLKAMQDLAPLCPALIAMRDQKRIHPKAFDGITKNIQDIFGEAVTKKTKELPRQFQVLLHLLQQNPKLFCLEYEATRSGLATPLDFILADRDDEIHSFILEIEGLPASEKDSAADYMEKRYIDKLSKIQGFVGAECVLLLATPVQLSAEVLKLLYEKGIPIIDLSNSGTFEKAVGVAAKHKF
jgi:hypothetical protein